MADRVPLANLMAFAAADGAGVVAWSGARAVTRAGWISRVRAWTAHFAARPGVDMALHLEDAVEFSAALFGGWHAGKTLWLPGDVLPATLDRLRSLVDAIVFDAAAVDECVAPSAFGALDPEHTRLRLYTSGSSGEPVAVEKTLRQLDSEVAALEARFGDQLGDALLQGTVSHQHIYGLRFRVCGSLQRARFCRHRLAPEQTLHCRQPQALIAARRIERLNEASTGAGPRSARVFSQAERVR